MEQTPPSRATLAAFATDAAVAREIAVRDDGAGADEAPTSAKTAMTVEHIAENNLRYPGDNITFYTRVTVKSAVPGFSVRVQVPAGLEITDYRSNTEEMLPVFLTVMEASVREIEMLPGRDGNPFPIAIPHQQTRTIEPARLAQDMVWRVLEPQEPGATHDFSVTALVLPVHKDIMLHSTATLSVVDGDDARDISSTTASVAVYLGSRLLEHLPSIFEQDGFMGRFLMLFESYWRPIDQQISSIHNYFDPDLTPARFLPWLASWFDLVLDQFWEEAQQRELLNNVMWLYRRRGTRVALQRYLEIFTRHPVEISEKRAKNMILGKQGRLGVGVALGTGNMPHTFTVRLQLDPIEPPSDLDAEAAATEAARFEKQRLALVNRMIMGEKPAHTSYRLEIVGPSSQDKA